MITPPSELTGKQLKFCQIYVSTGNNITESAKKAGYQKVNNVIDLLSNPIAQKYISDLVAESHNDLGITIMQKQKKLWTLAKRCMPINDKFSPDGELIKKGRRGCPPVVVSAISELNKMAGHHAISKIQVDTNDKDKMQAVLMLVRQHEKDY